MGIEYNYDDEYDYDDINIMTKLDEATDVRNELKQKREPEKTSNDHRLCPGESNESEVYVEEASDAFADPDRGPASQTTGEKKGTRTANQGSGEETGKKNNPITHIIKLDKSLKKLEESFVGSGYDTLSPGQKKYIRDMKRAMIRKFRDYGMLVDFCVEYANNTNNKRMIDPAEYLFYHIIYTMRHPELYVDLLCFDPFNKNIMNGGKYELINDFRKYLIM